MRHCNNNDRNEHEEEEEEVGMRRRQNKKFVSKRDKNKNIASSKMCLAHKFSIHIDLF